MNEPSSADSLSLNPIERPLPPVLLSTYLSESCSRGRLFESSTYDEKTFDLFLDGYVFRLINQVRIPDRFAPETVATHFRESLENWSVEYKKAVTTTDPDDARSVRRTVRKVRDEGADGIDHLIQFVKRDEFPSTLWLEIKRAKQAYLDSLEFVNARMEKWFDYAPKYKSQTRQRSLLAKSMMQPFRQLFDQFAESMTRFSTMFVFMEVWTCASENELFTEKLWSMEGVDRNLFDNAFEPMMEDFHQSISALRESYFASMAKTTATAAELGTSPVTIALRQLVTMSEVS